MTDNTQPIRVDRDRLWADLMQLEEIGAYDDATGLRGVRRLALTDADADADARRLVIDWMREAVLSVRAGHDAQEISMLCPTAMIFIAGENGGISHTPREYSTPPRKATGPT